MKSTAILLSMLSLIDSPAMADEYPRRTLVSGSVICYDAGDWGDMVEASLDQDQDAAERLINKGKCRIISSDMKTSLIEPEEEGMGALILLPSGKTAITSERFLR